MPFFDLAAATLPDYRSSVSAPDDFDEFWAATLGEAREHKLDAVFEPYDAGLPLVDVFDVKFAGYGGHPIRGWYIRPRAGKTDSGALVKFLGYNGGRGFPHEHLLWPASGRPVLVMDTRGQGAGLGAGRYRRSDRLGPGAGGIHDARDQRSQGVLLPPRVHRWRAGGRGDPDAGGDRSGADRGGGRQPGRRHQPCGCGVGARR